MSYYSVRDLPQLVQQRIIHYFPICDCPNGELHNAKGSFSVASSFHSISDGVSSGTDISGTPTLRVGDITWYLYCANLAIHFRQHLVQNPRTLFRSPVIEDGLPRQEYIYLPVTPSTARLVSSYFVALVS